MKKELITFAILAMVASSFLNAETSTQANDNLSIAKLRIENSSKIYEKFQQNKTVATNKSITKPNEG